MAMAWAARPAALAACCLGASPATAGGGRASDRLGPPPGHGPDRAAPPPARPAPAPDTAPQPTAAAPAARRSEEHTSELQSRETISYAVFCLKKKTRLYGPPPLGHRSGRLPSARR